jgi:hypothetical protein
MNARQSTVGSCSRPDFVDGGNNGVWALEHDDVPTVRNNDLSPARRKARLFTLQVVYPDIPDLVFDFPG